MRIIPKLQAEKGVHFGPGATPGNKRGTVEVHRGGPYRTSLASPMFVQLWGGITETYQFAYFFRKTEPHTVLFKVGNASTPQPPKLDRFY